jgi:hypothetical protein
MPHTARAWRAEIQAHLPQGSDLVELARLAPDVSEWRAMLAEDPDTRECLEWWEAFVQEKRLAVVLEQAMAQGDFPSERELAAQWLDCPAEWREPALLLARTAPSEIALYLAFASMVLVRIERGRRTGHAQWQVAAESGSPEVLQSLMFKWGPRFHRHRWTW